MLGDHFFKAFARLRMAGKRESQARRVRLRAFCFEPLESRLLLDANPIISEFMADNETTLKNSFNVCEDWIEICNTGNASVTLDNWCLTDARTALAKWSFADVLPAGQHVVLEPNQYLVVWADNRNTVVTTASGLEFHTNFSLDKDGEYLALVKPDGSTIASEYPIGNGLEGDYYQWTNQADVFNTANLKLSRLDATVNFAWNGAAPDPALAANNFAVRWTGKVKPVYTEAYTFTTVSDDGVRLWVNGQLLIDNWTSHNSTRNSAAITLGANTTYDIKMEYYQASASATAQLLWSSPHTPEQIIPESRLFDAGGYKFPGQYTDISFGLGQDISTKTLVGLSTPVNAYVPTSGTDANATGWNQAGFTPGAAWTSGTTSGVGFEASVAGFAVHTYLSAQGMGTVDRAENVINNVAGWRRAPVAGYAANPSVLNFTSGGSHGHFGTATPYPGLTTAEWDNIAVEAVGTITIPSPGTYTFCVNSDDGFSFRIPGVTTTWVYNSSTAAGSDTFSFDGGRGADDTLAQYSFSAAGQYSIRIVHFQATSAGSLEVSAAQGAYTAWASAFHLIGDTVKGGLYVEAPSVTPGSGAGTGSFRSLINTDLQTAMYQHNGSAYVVAPFNVTDKASYNSLTLRMKYDDGFVAWLNGTKIAQRNAPTAGLGWNSTATVERFKNDALQNEDIDVSAFLSSLVNGRNVLAIQILNSTVGSASDALVAAQLLDIDIFGVGQHYFSTPSPGAANTLEYFAKVKDTKFDGLATELDAEGQLAFHGRGYYDDFSVHVAATIAAATDTWTTTAAHGWSTGQPIRFASTATLPTSTPQIVAGTTYYLRATSATQFTVFATAADAAANTNRIDFTSAGTGILSVLCTAFHVILSSQTQTDLGGVTIMYTTDGSEPTLTHGTMYTAPIFISHTTTLRVAAFKADYTATGTDTQTYIFFSDVVAQPAAPSGFPSTWNSVTADYAMTLPSGTTLAQVRTALLSLPTMSITTTINDMFSPSGIYSNPLNDQIQIPGNIEYIDPNGKDYHAIVGFQIQGGFGRNTQFLEHSFMILANQADGPSKLDFDFFGDGAATSFQKLVLRASFNDGYMGGGNSATYMIDQWNRQTLGAMGDPASRGKYVQLFVDGLFWGVYNLAEHPDENFAAAYLGGNTDDYDVVHTSDIINGTADAWNQMFNLANSGNIAGGAVDVNALASDANYQLMQTYLDMPAFCDYILLNYWGANWDWDGNNWYAARNRNGGKFFFFPWDEEGNMSSTDKTGTDTPTRATRLFNQLRANADFRQLLADRIYRAFFDGGPLQPSVAQKCWTDLMGQLGPAILLQSARWGDYAGKSATPSDWTGSVNKILNNYLPGRTATVLAQFRSPSNGAVSGTATSATSTTLTDSTKVLYGDDRFNGWTLTILDGTGKGQTRIVTDYIGSAGQFVVAAWTTTPGATSVYSVLNPNMATPMYPSNDAPTFARGDAAAMDAPITTGFQLTISNPNASGVIYYTLDGSDPRLPGGGISPTARVATSGVPLAAFTGSTQVRARVKTTGAGGDIWSAMHEKAFVWAVPPTLRITEIMYHPAVPPVGSPFVADDFEFLELQNVGSAAVDLTGINFTQGITYTFAGGTLAPGAYGVLVKNRAAFESRYGTGVTILGIYDTSVLGDNGERIRLAGKFNEEILDFSYDADWFTDAGGGGFSLQILNPNANADTWGQKKSWRLSTYHNGSPGMVDPGLPPDSVVINELMAHTADNNPRGDWVEIKNITSQPVNVGGWYLSDADTNLKKYRIASGTVLQPGQVLLLTRWQNFENTADPGYIAPIHWTQFGGTVYLTMAEADGTLDGYRVAQDFEGSFQETSFGRFVTSDGNVEFVRTTVPTPGTEYAGSSYPYSGPIVINEIMYNPAPGGDEFIELYNTSDAPVSLYHSALEGDAWRLEGGISYTFTAPMTLAAHGYLLLVPNDVIDTATFAAKNGVPPGVPILSGYAGHLSNDSDSIRLYQPEDPDPTNNNRVPQIRSDRVEYRDLAPWPITADGTGPSLQRVSSSQYGNEPQNWYTGAADGTPGQANGMLDATPPRLSKVATTDGVANQVTVTFSEAVDPATALNPANYHIDQGVVILAATAGSNPQTVVLTTSTLAQGPVYILTVTGVTNAAGIAIPSSTTGLASGAFTYVGTGKGLKGEYFQYGSDFTNRYDASHLRLTRVDPTVNFQWGVSAPDAVVGADTFAVRWTGRIKVDHSETYTFYTVSDDGVSLWVDDQQLIADNGWHGDTEYSGSITLQAGTYYSIRMEQYEGTGGATARLFWSSPSTPKAIIPTKYLYDTLQPDLSCTVNQAAGQTSPTRTSPIHFTVSFTAPVSDFVSGDVTLGGTAGATTAVVTGPAGGMVYDVAVSGMTQNGTVTMSVAAGAAHDAAGNPNVASTLATAVYDVTALTVSINQAASQADPTNAATVNFTVVFIGPVSDFATGDVTVSGTAGATTAVVTGSGTTYNVAVSGMAGSGTVIVNLAAGVAHDASGKASVASSSSDNSVTRDIVAPSATVTPVAATTTSALNAATIQFSEPIKDTTFGLGKLLLKRNGITVSLVGATLTTSDSGRTWTVGNLADMTLLDGSYALSVPLSGTTITDRAGNLLAGTEAIATWAKLAGTITGTAAGNTIRIVGNSLDATKVDVFVNNGTTTPTYSAVLAGIPSWAITGLGGNDSLTLDFAHGNPLAGGIAFNGGTGGSDTLILKGLPVTGTPTVSANQVVFSGLPTINYSHATVVLDGQGNYTGATTVNSGVLRIDSSNALPATGSLVINAGTVVLNSGLNQAVKVSGLHLALPPRQAASPSLSPTAAAPLTPVLATQAIATTPSASPSVVQAMAAIAETAIMTASTATPSPAAADLKIAPSAAVVDAVLAAAIALPAAGPLPPVDLGKAVLPLVSVPVTTVSLAVQAVLATPKAPPLWAAKVVTSPPETRQTPLRGAVPRRVTEALTARAVRKAAFKTSAVTTAGNDAGWLMRTWKLRRVATQTAKAIIDRIMARAR